MQGVRQTHLGNIVTDASRCVGDSLENWDIYLILRKNIYTLFKARGIETKVNYSIFK